jgi:hypothetical protein
VTPRQYDLLLTRFQKFALVIPLIMFTVLPLAFLLFFVFGPVDFQEMPSETQPPFFPAFPLIFFFGFAAFYAWSVLSLPYRISVTHDQQLLFKSVLRSRSVRVSELLSIEPAHLNVQAGISGYVLKHHNGKIRFPGQFTGQYILLHELKQANPALDIKGC